MLAKEEWEKDTGNASHQPLSLWFIGRLNLLKIKSASIVFNTIQKKLMKLYKKNKQKKTTIFAL